MIGPFVHNIDPIIFSIGGVHIWFYGLSFTLGFLNAHLFLRRNRETIGLSLSKVYELTLFLAVGVSIGGRALVVINNEWDFYREHLLLIPSIWVGGFATHGLIFGGAAGVLLFCYINRVPLRPLLDVLAISAAIILGFGRIGNFIDGQIYGSITEVPWAVKFPVIESFRHPVVLYDGLKNFLLVPILLWIRSRGVPPGRIAVLFLIFYAGFRIPIDFFREYPNTLFGMPNGQAWNLMTVALGLILLAINLLRSRKFADVNDQKAKSTNSNGENPGWRRALLFVVCLIPLVIPSDATRDVPVSYGERHPAIEHSWMYPPIADQLEKHAEKIEH